LILEVTKSNFKYSVFGYGFRKSAIFTNQVFDDIALCIEDYDENIIYSDAQINVASKYFKGKTDQQIIKEFPD